MHDFSLILVDPNPHLCRSFRSAFAGLPRVETVEGCFEQLASFDCMVSAANSFGLMDGGVDAAITRFFGDGLQRRVQQRILDEYLGEQPVGTAMMVETDHPDHPYLAHAPTMRVPMLVADTDSAYAAMWAVLLAVRHHNRTQERAIKSLACPGLGTGTGGLSPKDAARQMALAYVNFLHPPSSITWAYAEKRHADIAARVRGSKS